MDLYLLRHAIAVEKGTLGCPDDSLRPLTPEGAKKMAQIAKGMKEMELSFEWILSSPYVRAEQTANIVADIFHAREKLKFVESLSAGANPKSLIEELKDQGFADSKNLLLVGHEPDLSSLTSLLLCGNSGVSIDFKKGGLCKLQIEKLRYGPCATLCWLLAPSHLVRLA